MSELTEREEAMKKSGIVNLLDQMMLRQLKSVIIPEGTTSLGHYKFRQFLELESVIFEDDSLTTIGSNVFQFCNKLDMELPKNVRSIGMYAFADCKNLHLTSFPDSLETIGDSCFSVCTSITSLTFNEGLKTIRSYAFNACTALATVTFKGTPTTLNKYCFSDCKNLKEINVPWSPDEVPDAPWGAINAQINYNYKIEEIKELNIFNKLIR